LLSSRSEAQACNKIKGLTFRDHLSSSMGKLSAGRGSSVTSIFSPVQRAINLYHE
jgi:hypothetical protein